MRVVGGTLALAPDRRAEVGRASADRRPPARGAVQHPRPRLRRSGHRRARARPVRRHRRARHRGDLARRGLRAVRRRRRARRARCCATMSRRSASAASPAFSAATPRSSGRRIRSSRSRSPSSIRPIGKGLAEKALASARDGGWLKPGALVVVEEAADAGFRRRRGSRNWSGATHTTITRSWSSCSAADQARSRRLQRTPPEQPLDIRQLQLDISRPAVVALAGIGHLFHLAQQRVHLLGLEPAPGAHRAVAGHGGGDVQQAALQAAARRPIPPCARRDRAAGPARRPRPASRASRAPPPRPGRRLRSRGRSAPVRSARATSRAASASSSSTISGISRIWRATPALSIAAFMRS